jgi:hypothetical protein
MKTTLRLSKLATMVMRLNLLACYIVNGNHSIM